MNINTILKNTFGVVHRCFINEKKNRAQKKSPMDTSGIILKNKNKIYIFPAAAIRFNAEPATNQPI